MNASTPIIWKTTEQGPVSKRNASLARLQDTKALWQNEQKALSILFAHTRLRKAAE